LGTSGCGAVFNLLVLASDRNSASQTASANGLLGHFRALAADLAWLRSYAAWERHDEAATELFIRLSTTLDDRVLGFWINGARILAYDMPSWSEKNAAENSLETMRIQQHAHRAIGFLDSALVHHPQRSALWIERANIQLNKLQDIAGAAESYYHASMQPDAPFYAARVYAELLRRLGRKAEALQWLRTLYPSLPQELEAAAASTVLSRIRRLEEELGVSSENWSSDGPSAL